MITHRLAAVAEADRIYVMADGRVAESGSCEELLARKGRVRAAVGASRQTSSASRLRSTPTSRRARPRRRATSAPRRTAGRTGRRAGTRPQSARGAPHVSVMLRLVGLVKPLLPWMVLAAALGVLGFLAAIFLTVLAAYALADAAGASAGHRARAACALVAACGIVRGPLRYGEQLCNHYLAFKQLALVRDKVFASLRRAGAGPRLEGRDKGDLVSLVTSDIELLEVFYAHTLSPAVIALVVSLGMAAFIATLSPVLGALALTSYVLVGVVAPFLSSLAAGSGGREVARAWAR